MGIIATILAGLIIGLLAKWVVPGRDPGGIIVTILIGIAGSFVGKFIAIQLGMGEMGAFSLGGIIMSVIGAAILLIGWRIVKKNMA
jgi:uncharacterized membrane protein YeaQ/YmgE (transglycosylase-associated protein family)